MTAFTLDQARRSIDAVLDAATREGQAVIVNEDGTRFFISTAGDKVSPLDVPGVDISLDPGELRSLMREIRERDHGWPDYPKVSGVEPLPGKCLRVSFDNGVTKVYDCAHLLDFPAFEPLRDEELFGQVHADLHGYAVIWNDQIDLAESELWVNGVEEA